MIQVSEKDFIGKGVNRTCYVNSENLAECIKFPIFEREGAERRMLREIKAHQRLKNLGVNTSRASLFLRTEKTDRGLGYVFPLIRDSDGSISKTLEEYYDGTRSGVITKSDLLELIREFYSICRENRFVLTEMHQDNVVVQRDYQSKVDKLIVIDGLGNFDFIKASNWFKYFGDRKLERKFKVLASRLGVDLTDLIGIR